MVRQNIKYLLYPNEIKHLCTSAKHRFEKPMLPSLLLNFVKSAPDASLLNKAVICFPGNRWHLPAF